MIVPDIGLLLYAHDRTAARHGDAQLWWAALLQGDEPIGIPWVTAAAFIRTASSPAVSNTMLAPEDAADLVRQWLDHEHVSWMTPTDQHLQFLFPYLGLPGVRPNLVTHPHVAALAVEHQATIHAAHPTFSRFPKLTWTNPLP